jgi:hypothetical protein
VSGPVCVFTSVCEADRGHVPRYLREMERLALPFAAHTDRCSPKTRILLANHPLFVGGTRQDDPAVEFDETHKQAVFDLVAGLGYRWALALDVDEVFERDAAPKIAAIAAGDDHLVTTRWLNLWLDEKHVRTDGPFRGGKRVKFYRLDKHRWRFLKPTVNGAYAVNGRGERLAEVPHVNSDLVCLHYGLMTPELCLEHRERWDRIYGKCGGNPYGTWRHACEATPEVMPNEFL